MQIHYCLLEHIIKADLMKQEHLLTVSIKMLLAFTQVLQQRFLLLTPKAWLELSS
jgi:hypothetical protein